jgi:hypothetical protein
MKTMKSYVLYLHPAICGTPDHWKAGKSITPYSAVRLRQRHMVKLFSLSKIWFGDPYNIDWLESQVHSYFKGPEIDRGNGEIVQGTLDQIETYINNQIKTANLNIVRLDIEGGYSARNAGQCPFGFPGEADVHSWAEDQIEQLFSGQRKRKFKQANNFEQLYDLVVFPGLVT